MAVDQIEAASLMAVVSTRRSQDVVLEEGYYASTRKGWWKINMRREARRKAARVTRYIIRHNEYPEH